MKKCPYLKNAKMTIHPITDSIEIHWEATVTTKGKRKDLDVNIPADAFRVIKFKPQDKIKVYPNPDYDSIILQRIPAKPIGQVEFEKKLHNRKIRILNEKIRKLQKKERKARKMLELSLANKNKNEIESFIKQRRKFLYNLAARINKHKKEKLGIKKEWKKIKGKSLEERQKDWKEKYPDITSLIKRHEDLGNESIQIQNEIIQVQEEVKKRWNKCKNKQIQKK